MNHPVMKPNSHSRCLLDHVHELEVHPAAAQGPGRAATRHAPAQVGADDGQCLVGLHVFGIDWVLDVPAAAHSRIGVLDLSNGKDVFRVAKAVAVPAPRGPCQDAEKGCFVYRGAQGIRTQVIPRRLRLEREFLAAAAAGVVVGSHLAILDARGRIDTRIFGAKASRDTFVEHGILEAHDNISEQGLGMGRWRRVKTGLWSGPLGTGSPARRRRSGALTGFQTYPNIGVCLKGLP